MVKQMSAKKENSGRKITESIIDREYLKSISPAERLDLYMHRYNFSQSTANLITEEYNKNKKPTLIKEDTESPHGMEIDQVDKLFSPVYKIECCSYEDVGDVISTALSIIDSYRMKNPKTDLAEKVFLVKVLPHKIYGIQLLNDIMCQKQDPDLRLVTKPLMDQSSSIKEIMNGIIAFSPKLSAISLFYFCELFKLLDLDQLEYFVEVVKRYRYSEYGINDAKVFEATFTDLFRGRVDPVDIDVQDMNDTKTKLSDPIESTEFDKKRIEVFCKDNVLKEKILSIIPRNTLYQKIISIQSSGDTVSELNSDWKGYLINDPNFELIAVIGMERFIVGYACFDRSTQSLYYISGYTKDKLFLDGLYRFDFKNNTGEPLYEKVEIVRDPSEKGEYTLKTTRM